LSVAVVRSEKLVAEAEESWGTQRKENGAVRNHYQATAIEDRKLCVCYSYSDLWNV
jgi:hypothetical protein